MRVFSLTLLAAFISLCSVLQGGASGLPQQNPSSVSFTLGRAPAVIVTDGVLHAPYIAFKVPREAISRSFAANFRKSGPITYQINILLIELQDGLTLVETGALNDPPPDRTKLAGLLMQSLANINVSPDSIKHVLISHGHRSRMGGLLTKDGKRAFPNAVVHITQAEDDFWKATPLKVTPDNKNLQTAYSDLYKKYLKPYEDANKVNYVKHGESPLSGVTFFVIPGHTDGSSYIEIEDCGSKLIITGDTWLSKSDQLQNPSWPFLIDSNFTQAYNSRIKLLEHLADNKLLALVYHEEFPGLGHVLRDKGGFDFVPYAVPRACDTSPKFTCTAPPGTTVSSSVQTSTKPATTVVATTLVVDSPGDSESPDF